MYECNILHFIHVCVQVHLLDFLKEIVHLLSALNMEHKKQSTLVGRFHPFHRPRRPLGRVEV
jgi:hypothetical protein